MEPETESGKNGKAFDEQTLARVLEAAYVLQEHNRQAREREGRHPEMGIATAASASGPIKARAVEPGRIASSLPIPTVARIESQPGVRPEYTVVLRRIVETQQKIQADHLELEYAMLLITERAAEMAQAVGAGIGLLNNGKVRYASAAGAMALPIESEVAVEKALCSACLRVGQVVRCTDVDTEFLVDVEECRRRGIQSMIAAPIHHSGNVVGALELYYPTTDAFAEPDVHTCQLMAGLVAESLARGEERTSEEPMGAAAMREVLEKVLPNLEALSRPAANNGSASIPPAAPAATVCRKCGCDLVADEQFCGECGWPCGSDYQGPPPQSRAASLWDLPESTKTSASGSGGSALPSFASKEEAVEFLRKQLPELFSHFESAKADANVAEEFSGMELVPVSAGSANIASEVESHPEAEVVQPTNADWSSAASARQFLEGFAKTNNRSTLGRFLRARRGDIYLAVAVILISIVIRWGIWSSGSANTASNPAAAAHRKPGADLPFYDRVLISLGLAEAPAPPENKGNPDTQVWVDVETALYYCPGADLYGKTPKGRLTTQRNAQLDQFEPAARKACD